ncbi:MAG: stage II sporulation protein M [Lachnospiraceae bacterium]|nr:stage II sporulation protein M [Lachnospiraceae bacterium]
MRFTKIRWKRAERPNWALPFFAGLVAGAALVYMNAGIFITDMGFLSRMSLERFKRVELNENAFFFYALSKRMGPLWLAAMLSTTFAGIVTTYLFVMWLGVCMGVVASVSIMRYGIKGILLLAGSMVPHYLCYIPAFFMLADLCFRICTKLYYPVRDFTETYEEKTKNFGILGNFLMVHAVVIIGVVLESYVNPNVMSELLKIF